MGEKKLKNWSHAVTRVPQLALTAITRGVLPAGPRAVGTIRKDGMQDLHWKILGDAMVRFLSNSGPVFTKFGQILATRTDLFPKAFCERLEFLYNKQAAMPLGSLNKLIKTAYPKDSPFSEFDFNPIGVGSVGQVHKARLKDGSKVVVKFIRPGSESAIDRDLATARALSQALFSVVKEKHGMSLMVQRMFDDLEQGFLSELDLKAEAASLRKFRKRLEGNPDVYVPKCYDQFSSEHVLVIEQLQGVPLSTYRNNTHVKSGKKSKHSPPAGPPGSKFDEKVTKRLASLALKEILSQIFESGQFHADPHAGNLMVLEDGRIGIIDFGLTGEFDKEDRKRIAKAVKAFMARKPDEIMSALLEFGTVPPGFDQAGFKHEIATLVKSRKAEIVESLSGKGDANLEGFVNDLFAIAYRYQVYVPQSTTLLIKTLVTIEGVARSLDPQINLVTVAIPIIIKSMTPKWLRWGSLF